MTHIVFVLFIWLSLISGAIASPLVERIQQFPQWESKPSLQVAKGDLVSNYSAVAKLFISMK
jgi:hypothetical protein